MSTITSVKLWYDTGYTEGACEIPPVGHTLGTPDIEIAGPINPSKGRLFNEFQVKEPYTDLMACSYLEVSVAFNNGETSKTFFGWVDSVTLASDTDDYPMTVIQWHVDLWRTYNAAAEYGSGFVQRRPSGASDLWQRYPYRRLELASRVPIFGIQSTTGTNVKRIMWAIIAYVSETGSSTVTEIVTYPLAHDVNIQFAGSMNINFPTWDNTFKGEWDEFFGLDPERITGCWLSPVPPFIGPSQATYSIDGISGDMTVTDIGWFELFAQPVAIKDPGTTYKHGAFRFKANDRRVTSLASSVTASETERIVLNGCFNERVGEIPFSWTVNTAIDFSFNISPINAMINIRYDPTANGSNGPNGLTFDIPLPSLDLNENSWSSYVYSGQRQYDQESRRLNSIKGGIEGAMGGIGSGAMVGGMVQAAGGPIGVGAGAIIGGISSMIKTGADLAYFNDQFQAIEDRYHAAMADGIMTAGFAEYMYWCCYGINLNVMHMDAESAAMVEDIKTVQGVRYGAPVQDCTSLIATGGPLQITNLIVKGDIPVEAKKWIREKMADGVRIIARS